MCIKRFMLAATVVASLALLAGSARASQAVVTQDALIRQLLWEHSAAERERAARRLGEVGDAQGLKALEFAARYDTDTEVRQIADHAALRVRDRLLAQGRGASADRYAPPATAYPSVPPPPPAPVTYVPPAPPPPQVVIVQPPPQPAPQQVVVVQPAPPPTVVYHTPYYYRHPPVIVVPSRHAPPRRSTTVVYHQDHGRHHDHHRRHYAPPPARSGTSVSWRVTISGRR